jgi:succinyl-diaminopimelate desuccinylase
MSFCVMVDGIELAQKLIRCPSVTPHQAGCLDVLTEVLTALGFRCQRLPFGDVDNLYARRGDVLPNFCFAGHIDVVPIFQENLWSYPPFAATIADDTLYGRGAVDMKGAIAAFVAAVAGFLQKQECPGSISLLLTSDEEGPATHGTVQVLKALQDQGETLTVCLVGEPTCTTFVGDTLKVGRRGSLNVDILAQGTSGHVAYPHLARNAIPILLEFLERLTAAPLDTGCPHFDPSNLEVISLDVGNATYNVIPAQATARINIRFNPLYTSVTLMEWLQAQIDTLPIQLTLVSAAESFHGGSDPQLIECLQSAVEDITGNRPILSTSGGTSDARFIKDFCPVIEFGLLNTTAHQVDERVTLQDLQMLQRIYQHALANFFACYTVANEDT